MSRLHESGNWTVATAVSPLIAERPFQDIGDNREYVFRQTFWQNLADYEALPLGTQHENGAYLVRESTPSNKGHGVIEFERTWAHVPERQIQLGTITHTFTGQVTGNLLRATKAVPGRIYIDFFYAPGELEFQIPIYSAARTIRQSGRTITFSQEPYTQGGAAVPAGFDKPIPLRNNAGKVIRLIAEDSSFDRWMGDIFKRSTPTVPNFTFSQSGILGISKSAS